MPKGRVGPTKMLPPLSAPSMGSISEGVCAWSRVAAVTATSDAACKRKVRIRMSIYTFFPRLRGTWRLLREPSPSRFQFHSFSPRRSQGGVGKDSRHSDPDQDGSHTRCTVFVR